MVNFDKFEKRVKETYGKQEFPFDEQNWEKASKLIDASRQGKNRGGIFLLSAVALLCTTGLVYYFGFSDSTDALKKNSLASNNTNSNTELVVKTEADTQTSGANANTVANSASNNKDVANSNSSTAETEKNNSSTNLNGTSTTKTSVSKTKVQEKTEVIVSDNNTVSKPTETKSEEKSTNTSENKTNSNSSNSKKPEAVKSNSKNTTPPVLGSNTNQNSVKPNSTNPIAGNGGNSDKEGDANAPTNPIKNTTTVIDSANSIAVVDIMSTESVVIDSSQTIKQMPADSFKFPAIPKGDGISYATNVKMEHNHKNFLFMEAGATYLFGWTGNNGNDADGFNLVAGVNFQHYFTNNISTQIGAQYNSIGNMTQTSHTISTVNYDLGIEQDITSIKYQKLHYVVAPIKLAINAGKDNILGIGCNVAYLLNSESKKEKYKTYSTDPNAIKNNLTSTKETGYLQGFNPIDVQVSAFYRRKIYKGLSANAEFIFGLTDTKSNAFFKSNTFERTTGFKLTLCYDLFKK